MAAQALSVQGVPMGSAVTVCCARVRLCGRQVLLGDHECAAQDDSACSVCVRPLVTRHPSHREN